MSRTRILPQLLRFAAVGILVMAFFTGLNWLLEPRCGRQGAFLLAYPPALGLHFCLNRWWTFAARGPGTRRQVGEYLVMVAATFALQWGVFAALGAWTRLPGWISAAAANAAQMGVSFLAMRWRVFAARHAA